MKYLKLLSFVLFMTTSSLNAYNSIGHNEGGKPDVEEPSPTTDTTSFVLLLSGFGLVGLIVVVVAKTRKDVLIKK